uniref:Uncharacterized protein n=1 Tax=Opuntia streptacantha TaxID=393608 RepID=A0A7C8Z125_OPUST
MDNTSMNTITYTPQSYPLSCWGHTTYRVSHCKGTTFVDHRIRDSPSATFCTGNIYEEHRQTQFINRTPEMNDERHAYGTVDECPSFGITWGRHRVVHPIAALSQISCKKEPVETGCVM